MKLGFIGGGNMAFAIFGGVLANNVVSAENIFVSDIDTATHKKFNDKGVKTSSDIGFSLNGNYIILAVKPHIIPIVLSELKEKHSDEIKDKVFVSIAAGISAETIRTQLGFSAKVVRIMPNTPALVGEGMSVIAKPLSPVSDEEFENVLTIFSAVGEVEVMDESMLNSVVAVSGSSPAYVFMMIEAMADAAVRDGIARQTAYKLAAQSVLGSAKMVLETKKHPAELKDMVCSPRGTTIEAVSELEKCGFRNALISAMKKCTDKTNNL